MTSPIDDLDARLITLMADEPRIGLMEVSRRLNIARGTVQARLAKLTERGVIRSFGPEVDPSKVERRNLYALLRYQSWIR